VPQPGRREEGQRGVLPDDDLVGNLAAVGDGVEGRDVAVVAAVGGE
jgi:hypothetical protein